jgi:uncharacterized membrane protein
MTGVVILVLVTAALSIRFEWVTSFLVAWCIATSYFVIESARKLTGHSEEKLRKTAADLDPTAATILVLAAAVSVASLVAVVSELAASRCPANALCAPAGVRAARVALTGATLLCSWFFVQATFAVHYMHLFYGSDDEVTSRGGLVFAGDDAPDFLDFIYFAVSVGATSQTSDTAVSSHRMRRIVTAHAIFAFFFNTTVLALTVNIAASLLN